jgi:hypothetical protein
MTAKQGVYGVADVSEVRRKPYGKAKETMKQLAGKKRKKSRKVKGN